MHSVSPTTTDQIVKRYSEMEMENTTEKWVQTLDHSESFGWKQTYNHIYIYLYQDDVY